MDKGKFVERWGMGQGRSLYMLVQLLTLSYFLYHFNIWHFSKFSQAHLFNWFLCSKCGKFGAAWLNVRELLGPGGGICHIECHSSHIHQNQFCFVTRCFIMLGETMTIWYTIQTWKAPIFKEAVGMDQWLIGVKVPKGSPRTYSPRQSSTTSRPDCWHISGWSHAANVKFWQHSAASVEIHIHRTGATCLQPSTVQFCWACVHCTFRTADLRLQWTQAHVWVKLTEFNIVSSFKLKLHK